jgi:hypothetical protein
MDKRTARREYRHDFIAAISDFRSRHASEIRNLDRGHRNLSWDGDQCVRVCVRKRPIFKQELVESEFDVVSVLSNKKVIIHDARMHSDMKRQFMNNHEFDFDVAFDETSDNEEVYKCAVAELVKFSSIEGGYGTCLVYGQTGTKRAVAYILSSNNKSDFHPFAFSM